MKTLLSTVVLAIMVAFTALIGTNAANANVAMRITAPIEITKNSDVVKVHRRNYRHNHRRHYRRSHRRHYRRPRIYITPPRVHYRRGGHSHWHYHHGKRHRHKHWRGHHH